MQYIVIMPFVIVLGCVLSDFLRLVCQCNCFASKQFACLELLRHAKLSTISHYIIKFNVFQQQRNLSNVYKAFSHCVSLLGEHGGVCAPLEDLVSALFEFRFQQHSESVGTAFTQLLWFVSQKFYWICCPGLSVQQTNPSLPCFRSNLVSANNIFLRPALDMLAKNFLPIPKGQMYTETPATSDAPGDVPVFFL